MIEHQVVHGRFCFSLKGTWRVARARLYLTSDTVEALKPKYTKDQRQVDRDGSGIAIGKLLILWGGKRS